MNANDPSCARGDAGAPAVPALDADPEAVARTICLRLLTQASRTRAQLADALRRRGVSEDVAGIVLGRFTDAGLIDDAAFAAAWVESRHHGRGLARRALAHELLDRGVAGDIVSRSVGMLDEDDEAATARALVARRLPSTRGLPPPVRARRLAGLLSRKGYSAAVALRVVREALAEDHDATAGEVLDLEGWLGPEDCSDAGDTFDSATR